MLLILSHTRMAALPITATGTTTRRCNARQGCKTCLCCWHLLPHADGRTAGSHPRHGGVAQQPTQEKQEKAGAAGPFSHTLLAALLAITTGPMEGRCIARMRGKA